MFHLWSIPLVLMSMILRISHRIVLIFVNVNSLATFNNEAVLHQYYVKLRNIRRLK